MRKPRVSWVVLLLCGCLWAVGVATAWGGSASEDVIYRLPIAQVDELLAEREESGMISGYIKIMPGIWYYTTLLGQDVFLEGSYEDGCVLDFMTFYYVEFPADATYGKLEHINAWNRERRFSRAYVDADGDAVLEFDLDLEGGVTLGAVDAFLNLFDGIAFLFEMYIIRGG